MVHSTSLVPLKLFLSITSSNASGAQPHGFNYYNMCAQSLQSCPTLCDPMDCSPPGSSVHGDSPGKKIGVGCHFFLQGIFLTLMSPALAGLFFTTSVTWELPDYYNPPIKCLSTNLIILNNISTGLVFWNENLIMTVHLTFGTLILLYIFLLFSQPGRISFLILSCLSYKSFKAFKAKLRI